MVGFTETGMLLNDTTFGTMKFSARKPFELLISLHSINGTSNGVGGVTWHLTFIVSWPKLWWAKKRWLKGVYKSQLSGVSGCNYTMLLLKWVWPSNCAEVFGIVRKLPKFEACRRVENFQQRKNRIIWLMSSQRFLSIKWFPLNKFSFANEILQLFMPRASSQLIEV